MKIATITCHRVYNHGAALQAWALATYLKSQGHDVNIMDYRPDYLSGQYDLKVNNSRFDKPVIKWLYLLAKVPSWLKALPRKSAFDKFDEKYIAPLVTKKCYSSYEELKQYAPDSDVYIAGSDQIWNTKLKNGTDAAFYLDFGNSKVKKLSYAASFATSALREGTETFVKSELKNFDAISVREPSGVSLLESMGYSSTLVCDPVFLIDADVWSKNIATKDGEGEKYVLVYDFEGSEEVANVAKKIANSRGLKIFTVGYRTFSYAQKNYVNVGPDAFVALVKNASCVVSNSFHATAFSFIFRKDMYVVRRADGLNTRMQDLLGRYGLAHRLVDSSCDLTADAESDYSNMQDVLRQEIDSSKIWLNQSIESDYGK